MSRAKLLYHNASWEVTRQYLSHPEQRYDLPLNDALVRTKSGDYTHKECYFWLIQISEKPWANLYEFQAAWEYAVTQVLRKSPDSTILGNTREEVRYASVYMKEYLEILRGIEKSLGLDPENGLNCAVVAKASDELQRQIEVGKIVI